MEQEALHGAAGCQRTGGSGVLWQENATPENTWLLHNRITFDCSRATTGSHLSFPHLSGIHDSAYSNCQSHGGHFGEVTIKEPGIGQYGVHGQGLHSCPGHQTGPRLVEGDVTVRADTWDRDSRGSAVGAQPAALPGAGQAVLPGTQKKTCNSSAPAQVCVWQEQQEPPYKHQTIP